MQLRWRGANIVLLAQNHNPSILSPDWIQQHGVIEEPHENFIHTPVFSLYLSKTFQLVVQEERFQLTLRVLSESTLQTLQEAATRYIGVLPQVPYRSVGLNFFWIAVAEQPQEGFNRISHLFLSARERIRTSFPDGKVKIGSLLYNEAHGYRLRLQVDPQLETEGDLGLNFNYHFDVRSHTEAQEAVSRLASCLSSAELSSKNLLGMT